MFIKENQKKIPEKLPFLVDRGLADRKIRI